MALGGRANSFPQKAKIKKSQDFLTVLKARGKGVVRLSGQWFELKAVLTQGKVSSRFGLTVGKHFSKRSVDRNLVKRILREAIRHSVLTHPAESPSALQSRTFVLRLKKKVPVPAEGARLNSLKKELSEDANRLLSQLEASPSGSKPSGCRCTITATAQPASVAIRMMHSTYATRWMPEGKSIFAMSSPPVMSGKPGITNSMAPM